MSPVWVKLGDFRVSKRILTPATTTLHTQVSTPVYSAPEVLGLDPNSETSNYTNSVDIWSLGCVVYELLVGERLFVSEFQLYRYFYGTWAFPEESLRVLSPPIDDTGNPLLRAMLAIKPGYRPTAICALGNSWLTGLKDDNEENGGDKYSRTQSRDRSTLSNKSKNRLATHNQPKKKRERGPITQDGAKCTPGGADFWAEKESKMGGDISVAQSSFDTSMVTLSDAAPAETLVAQTGSWKSGIAPKNFQETHTKSPKRVRKKQIHNTPRTCNQSRAQNTTPTFTYQNSH